MSSIGLVVDNVCSLPEKIANDFGLEFVNTKLYFPELEKLPGKNMYQAMKETKAYPETSAPSPGDYLEVYKKLLAPTPKFGVGAERNKTIVGINYTDNIELAFKLKERIEKELKTEVAFTSLAPPIIGANSGPGTLIAGTLPLMTND